jgi:hypothetical protein
MRNIRLYSPDDILLARDNWVIAFFLPEPFPPVAQAARAAFDLWRATAPADAIKWALVGASAGEAKPVGPKTLDRCIGMLDPAAAARREITAFRLFGPAPDTPGHLFEVVGDRERGEGFLERLVGLIQIWFPTEFLTPRAVAEFACRVAELLPYISGYVAPALAFGSGVDTAAAGQAIRGLAFRHPGYDLPRNKHTRYKLGQQLIGARWITFLGPQQVEQLGGPDAIAAAVPGVTVAAVGHGLMLRAGDEPETGDVNRRVDTPLLRVVAKAIEPITLFGNPALEEVFGNDPDALDRWEQRFLA